jgi:hypothetical protein
MTVDKQVMMMVGADVEYVVVPSHGRGTKLLAPRVHQADAAPYVCAPMIADALLSNLLSFRLVVHRPHRSHLKLDDHASMTQ